MNRLFPVVLLLAILNPTNTWAAVSTYASREEWESSVGIFDVENFESTPLQQTSCPDFDIGFGCPHEVTIEAARLNIVIPVGAHSLGYDGIFDGGAVNGSREFRADLHAGVLVAGSTYNTIVFPDPVVSFAVDLANVIDYDEFCQASCGPVPFPMTIVIDGQESRLAYGTRFFGAVSDVPFVTVEIRSSGYSGGYAVLPSLDEISFTVVPEPSSTFMIGIGLLVLSCSGEAKRAA